MKDEQKTGKNQMKANSGKICINSSSEKSQIKAKTGNFFNHSLNTLNGINRKFIK